MKLNVVDGDLLDQDVEVIVNAWNRNAIPWRLLGPQGVSRAIRRRAGKAPFRELSRMGPIPLGGAAVALPLIGAGTRGRDAGQTQRIAGEMGHCQLSSARPAVVDEWSTPHGGDMSYDLMVFDPAAAPQDRAGFMKWYEKQADWGEGHSYDDPNVCSDPLRAWFLEMITLFPPMNGPLASPDFDDPKVTDYSVGSSVIYAAFAWSEANSARATMLELAQKHRVGFFDVSSRDSGIWQPTRTGGYARVPW